MQKHYLKKSLDKSHGQMSKSLTMLKLTSFSKLDLRINQHSQTTQKKRVLLEHQAFSPEDTLQPANTHNDQDDQPHTRSINKTRLMNMVDYLKADKFQGLQDVQRLKKDNKLDSLSLRNQSIKQLLARGRSDKKDLNRSHAYLRHKEKAVHTLDVQKMVDDMLNSEEGSQKGKTDNHRLKEQSLMAQIGRLRRENEEMQSALDIYKETNNSLRAQYESLQKNYTQLIEEQTSLLEFREIQKELHSDGGTLSIQDILKKNTTLQNLSISQQESINTLQEKNRRLKKQVEQRRISCSQQGPSLQVETVSNQQDHILAQKEEHIKQLESFREQLLAVHNKVMGMFLRWGEQQKIYYDVDSLKNTNQLTDCLEVLAVMEQMVKLDNNERLQAYLRKIVVSTNQLQKRWLPQHVGEQYQPEVIYQRLNKLLSQQESSLSALRKDRH